MSINKKIGTKMVADLKLITDPASRLVAWNDVKAVLDQVKKIESALRKEMLGEFFSNREEGTNNHSLGADWKAVCKQPMSRAIDVAKLDEVMAKMPRGSKQKLVKVEHKLILGEYRKLDEKTKAIFDDALTLKKGTATLELVAPKTVEL